jgi:hypothetical protein
LMLNTAITIASRVVAGARQFGVVEKESCDFGVSANLANMKAEDLSS